MTAARQLSRNRARGPVMSPLKHNPRKLLLCTLTLTLLSALLSACARTEQPAEAKKDKPQPRARATPTEIDRGLARAAAEALGDREGAVLVMDPHTGRVRAVVNPRLAYEQAFPP